jgi:hypothetical protein
MIPLNLFFILYIYYRLFLNCLDPHLLTAILHSTPKHRRRRRLGDASPATRVVECNHLFRRLQQGVFKLLVV